MVASSTRAMMAQRLVRKICKKCGEPSVPTEKELQALDIDITKLEKTNFRKGKGCPDCNGTGNRGRMGIFEVYVLNDESRHLINAKAPAAELRPCPGYCADASIPLSCAARPVRSRAFHERFSSVGM